MFSTRIQSYIKPAWLTVMALLVFFTPQVNDSRLENGTIITKTLFFSAGIILLSLSGSISLAVKKNLTFNLSAIDIACAAFVLHILLRLYPGNESISSARAIDLLSLSFFYILLRCSSKITLLALLYTIPAAGIVQAYYGILQLYDFIPVQGSFKLTGSFFNTSAFSSFLAISAVISLGLLLFSKEFLNELSTASNRNLKKIFHLLKPLPVLNLALSIILLPVSLNRTAWIAFLLGALLLYSCKTDIARFSKSKKITIAAIAAVIFFTLFTGAIILKKESANGRMLIWKVTTTMISDHLITGVGYDRFQAEYMNYQATYLAKYASEREKLLADNIYYAFNDLLQTTAELGIGGLIIILWLISACCFTQIKGNCYGYIAKATLLAYLATCLFYYPHQVLALKMLLVLSLALLAKTPASLSGFSRTIRFNKGILITGVLILFLCGATGLFGLKKLEYAYTDWKKASEAYQSENYSRSLACFNKALPYLKNNGDFLSQLGKTYAIADSSDQAAFYLQKSKLYLSNTIIETTMGDIYKAAGKYAEAEKHYQTALNMVPNKFYTEYLLLRLYTDSHDPAKACQKASDILHKPVKIFSTALQQVIDSAKAVYVKNNCP